MNSSQDRDLAFPILAQAKTPEPADSPKSTKPSYSQLESGWRKLTTRLAGRIRHLSPIGVVMAAILPVSYLGLFYSLAAHMYLSLGRWPSSIGTQGFGRPLILHANAQYWLLNWIAWISFFVWPVAVLVCSVVPKARRLLPYLAIYAFTVVVCWLHMQTAPGPFLYWWRD